MNAKTKIPQNFWMQEHQSRCLGDLERGLGVETSTTVGGENSETGVGSDLFLCGYNKHLAI